MQREGQSNKNQLKNILFPLAIYAMECEGTLSIIQQRDTTILSGFVSHHHDKIQLRSFRTDTVKLT